MLSNNDYVYGFDIINDDELKKILNKTEKQELKHRISPVYFFNSKKTRNTVRYHDSQNRLEVHENDVFDYRYEVVKKLGKGAFSNVYLCRDYKRNIQVAIKVIRNERRFHKQVNVEINLLDLLNTDKDYSPNVIRLLKSFDFRGDIFLVFPKFGIDLYSYYKNNEITEDDVKSFSYQIARGLDFIHSFFIIHMDLKPENILVKNNQLKIIDFGSSFVEKPTMKKDYVQSRYYRAPDVVFGQKTTTKIDIWSYGCIIYELATKTPLIPARCSKDLVIYYCYIMGYPPEYMESVYGNTEYFNEITRDLVSCQTIKGKFLYPKSFKWNYDNTVFKQLVLNCCLNWDSSKMLTASEILEHPYFYDDDSSDEN